MLKVNIAIALIITTLSSCEYERNQKIPQDVRVLSKDFIGKSVYKAYEYKLENCENTDMNNWQKALVCQGYTERSISTPWIKFEKLNEANKENAEFYITLLDSLSANFINPLKEKSSTYWYADCRYESYSGNGEAINVMLYAVYFLDKENGFLFEFKDED